MNVMTETPASTTIASAPYPWPYDGDLRLRSAAPIVIEMQADFCGPGGHFGSTGYEIALARAPIEPIGG